MGWVQLFNFYNVMQYEVEAIIGKRQISPISNTSVYSDLPQYLVKWKNYPVEDSSWEPLKNLKNSLAFVHKYQRQNSLAPTISVVKVKDKDTNQRNQLITKKNKGKRQKDKVKQQEQATDKINTIFPEKRYKKVKRQSVGKLQIEANQNELASQKRPRGNRQLKNSDEESTQKIFQKRKLIIKKMALRNKCRFFEVEKDGKSSWRGRKYMIEFHPKELCEYYEKLVLERGL